MVQIWRQWSTQFAYSPGGHDHVKLHPQHVFKSLGVSRSVGEEAECNLPSVNFWSESDPRRAFWLALRVTCILVELVWEHDRHGCVKLGTTSERRELWEHHWSSCDKFGSTLEHWRELWEHLGPLPNQCGNSKLTLRDASVVIDIDLENCGQYLRLSRCIRATDYPP